MQNKNSKTHCWHFQECQNIMTFWLHDGFRFCYVSRGNGYQITIDQLSTPPLSLFRVLFSFVQVSKLIKKIHTYMCVDYLCMRWGLFRNVKHVFFLLSLLSICLCCFNDKIRRRKMLKCMIFLTCLRQIIFFTRLLECVVAPLGNVKLCHFCCKTLKYNVFGPTNLGKQTLVFFAWNWSPIF